MAQSRRTSMMSRIRRSVSSAGRSTDDGSDADGRSLRRKSIPASRMHAENVDRVEENPEDDTDVANSECTQVFASFLGELFSRTSFADFS